MSVPGPEPGASAERQHKQGEEGGPGVLTKRRKVLLKRVRDFRNKRAVSTVSHCSPAFKEEACGWEQGKRRPNIPIEYLGKT